MISQHLSCLFWNCIGVSNKAFFRVYNTYFQDKRPAILIIMEIYSDPGNLNHTFAQLGFPGFAFTDSGGFAEVIAMGWKTDRVQVTIL